MSDENTNNTDSSQNDGGQSNNDQGGGGGGADWKTSISEDLRSHVAGFEKPDDFVKAFVDTKGKVPSIPDKPDGYKIEFEGVEIPKELQEKASKQYEGWREWAQKNQLTQAQFKNLISEDAKMRMGNVKAAKDAFDKSEKALKEDWKNEYEANLTKAEETVKQVFDEDFLQYAKDSGIANHPKFVKAMFELSKKVSEDTFTRNEGGSKDKVQRDPVTGQRMLKYKDMP